MNQIDLAGKVAIVTGGARGIGYAISERLLQSGAKVALWDVDADAMAQAEKELATPEKVMSAKVDITSEQNIDAALTATEKGQHPGDVSAKLLCGFIITLPSNYLPFTARLARSKFNR